MNLYSVKADQAHDPLSYHEEYVDGDVVPMEEGDKFYFRCIAKNSNPPAEISIFFNGKDITHQVIFFAEDDEKKVFWVDEEEKVF